MELSRITCKIFSLHFLYFLIKPYKCGDFVHCLSNSNAKLLLLIVILRLLIKRIIYELLSRPEELDKAYKTLRFEILPCNEKRSHSGLKVNDTILKGLRSSALLVSSEDEKSTSFIPKHHLIQFR